MEIVAADIGGTHARFAIAEIEAGRVKAQHEAIVLKTADYYDLAHAWRALSAMTARPLPRLASIAVATPVNGDVLKFTNAAWIIKPSALEKELGLDHVRLLNDFQAMGHAIAHLDDSQFVHVCGPDEPLPIRGVISVIGPGTGLGVAQVQRHKRRYYVTSTEGGHIGFAPFDLVEDQLLSHLRAQHSRVSAERLLSGPGLASIYGALAAIQGTSPAFADEAELWAAAIASADKLAAAALDRFCLGLGGFAGDIALAHGASAVVIAGGLAVRILEQLRGTSFSDRFAAKGRFSARMAAMPVKLLIHKQPGLFGAAAAYAQDIAPSEA